MSILLSILRCTIFPVTLGAGLLVTHAAIQDGASEFAIVAVVTGVAAVLTLVLERVIPYLPLWNQAIGDLRADTLHALFSTAAIPELFKALCFGGLLAAGKPCTARGDCIGSTRAAFIHWVRFFSTAPAEIGIEDMPAYPTGYLAHLAVPFRWNRVKGESMRKDRHEESWHACPPSKIRSTSEVSRSRTACIVPPSSPSRPDTGGAPRTRRVRECQPLHSSSDAGLSGNVLQSQRAGETRPHRKIRSDLVGLSPSLRRWGSGRHRSGRWEFTVIVLTLRAFPMRSGSCPP